MKSVRFRSCLFVSGHAVTDCKKVLTDSQNNSFDCCCWFSMHQKIMWDEIPDEYNVKWFFLAWWHLWLISLRNNKQQTNKNSKIRIPRKWTHFLEKNLNQTCWQFVPTADRCHWKNKLSPLTWRRSATQLSREKNFA